MKSRWLCCLAIKTQIALSAHRSTIWLVLVGVAIAGCARFSTAADAQSEPAQRVAAILQASGDWRPLFNGKNLDGWQGDTEGYIVRDGVLVCQKGAKYLTTQEQFSDFAFSFEFKLEPSGNNGIGIRVPSGGHPSSDGMEIQILDHHGDRYQTETKMADGSVKTLSWLKPWQYHGSIYGIYPAEPGPLKPAGQWNRQTIIAIEDHIMVILNDAIIVDVLLEELEPVDGKDHPGMRRKTGHLMLTGHNDHVEFRNLQIADYAPSPSTTTSSQDNTPPSGFVALFNGKDLSGWKGLAHNNANERRALEGEALEQAQAKADASMREHWSVVDGVLTYDGKGQSLCTAKDYGDFELYVDWKIPPGADSGIYLRGTPQVQIWDPWDPRVKEGEDFPATPEQWVAAFQNGRNLGSGGLWNNRRWRNAPLTLADKGPGEWNRFFIRMVGDKVSIWLNDKLIVDRVALENYWDKSGETPLARADQIELQHHGSELYFKNLYIRELPY